MQSPTRHAGKSDLTLIPTPQTLVAITLPNPSFPMQLFHPFTMNDQLTPAILRPSPSPPTTNCLFLMCLPNQFRTPKSTIAPTCLLVKIPFRSARSRASFASTLPITLRYQSSFSLINSELPSG